MSEEIPATANPVVTENAQATEKKGKGMNKAKMESLLWRMATIRGILFSASSLWVAWSTATQGIDMPQLGWWDWSQTIGGCICTWFLTMMAFIDKSAQQLSAGKIPGLENGNHETKEES